MTRKIKLLNREAKKEELIACLNQPFVHIDWNAKHQHVGIPIILFRGLRQPCYRRLTRH